MERSSTESVALVMIAKKVIMTVRKGLRVERVKGEAFCVGLRRMNESIENESS